MTRVDFYLLKENNLTARHIFACKIIEKAYHQGHTVFIKTANQHDAQLLDDLLWTFKEDSFIPHKLYEEDTQIIPPIQISSTQIPVDQTDVLLNLTLTLPATFKQFQRIIEIFPQTDELRNYARNLYRQYRDAGCEMNLHDLGKN